MFMIIVIIVIIFVIFLVMWLSVTVINFDLFFLSILSFQVQNKGFPIADPTWKVCPAWESIVLFSLWPVN